MTKKTIKKPSPKATKKIKKTKGKVVSDLYTENQSLKKHLSEIIKNHEHLLKRLEGYERVETVLRRTLEMPAERWDELIMRVAELKGFKDGIQTLTQSNSDSL